MRLFLLELTYWNEEEFLEFPYALPENEDYSEEDYNEDATEELVLLEVTNSECDEMDGAFAVAVDVSEEGPESDRQSSDTSEDENKWCDSVSYYGNITRDLDQYPFVCPDLTQEDTEAEYLLCILTEKYRKLFGTRQISTQHSSATDDLEVR